MLSEEKIRKAAEELSAFVSPSPNLAGSVTELTEWLHKVLGAEPPVIEPTDVFTEDTEEVIRELSIVNEDEIPELIEELPEDGDSLEFQIRDAKKIRDLKDVVNVNKEFMSLRGKLGQYSDINVLRDAMYGIIAVKKVEEITEAKSAITINPAFKQACPKLTEQEYNDLEKLILKDGRIINPILIWNNFIVDGHNRYEIAQKHNLSFVTKTLDFKTENEAVMWIKENAISQRNLTDFARYELLKDIEIILKAEGRKRQSLAGKRIKTDLPPKDSRKEFAEKMNVSPAQVAKIRAVDKKATPELKEKLRTGKVKVGTALKELKIEDVKEAPMMSDKDKLEHAAKELDKWVIKYQGDELYTEFTDEVTSVAIRMRENF